MSPAVGGLRDAELAGEAIRLALCRAPRPVAVDVMDVVVTGSGVSLYKGSGQATWATLLAAVWVLNSGEVAVPHRGQSAKPGGAAAPAA